MMWRIEAPNNEYNGVTAGVTFVGGVGETDVDPSDYFQRHGYTVGRGAGRRTEHGRRRRETEEENQ